MVALYKNESNLSRSGEYLSFIANSKNWGSDQDVSKRRSAEENLLEAVLIDGVKWALLGAGKDRDWVFEESEADYLLTFSYLCESLDICKNSLRRKIKSYISGPDLWRLDPISAGSGLSRWRQRGVAPKREIPAELVA